jgi:hypothetical protein
MNFNMKAPCANCPFLKEGAIDLHPGRLDGIKAHLLESDGNIFMCHKTVHSKLGGKWAEDDDRYIPSGHESYCMGAAAYQWHHERESVIMRVEMLLGRITPDQLEAIAEQIDLRSPPATGHEVEEG